MRLCYFCMKREATHEASALPPARLHRADDPPRLSFHVCAPCAKGFQWSDLRAAEKTPD